MPLNRKRRSSTADTFAAQFEGATRGQDLDPEAGDKPVMDDFDADYDTPIPSAVKNASKLQRKDKKRRLSLKGGLDHGLSEGKYAASAVDVESAMDDIFGGLEDDVEGEAGAAKLKTQDAYEAWLEENEDAVGKHREPRTNERDGDILRQIEELRDRQNKTGAADVAIVNEEAAHDSSASTEYAKALFDAFHDLVQLRLKLQPAIQMAVRLPEEGSRAAFTQHDAAIKKEFAANNTALRSLLQEFLAFGSIDVNTSTAGLTSLWKDASDLHKDVMKKANLAVEDWGTKAIAASAPQGKKSADLQVINRSLADQIQGVLEGGKLRLLDRTRRNRQHSNIFGFPPHWHEQSDARALRIADGDINPNVFDDPDFLRELIHRSMAALSRTNPNAQREMEEVERQLGATEREGTASRAGLHRLTKGKAISYEPRPKLVGFMVPVPYAEGSELQHGALVSSLFK